MIYYMKTKNQIYVAAQFEKRKKERKKRMLDWNSQLPQ